MFILYISMLRINYVEMYRPFFLFTLIAKFTFTSCRMISSAINTLIETVIQELRDISMLLIFITNTTAYKHSYSFN